MGSRIFLIKLKKTDHRRRIFNSLFYRNLILLSFGLQKIIHFHGQPGSQTEPIKFFFFFLLMIKIQELVPDRHFFKYLDTQLRYSKMFLDSSI